MPYGIKHQNRIDSTPMEKKYYFELNAIVYMCACMYAFMCIHDVCIVCSYVFIHASMRMYVQY